MEWHHNLKRSLLNAVNGFLTKYLKDSDLVQHTISLGIFGVFASSYLKVAWATKDFASLDWGWVVLLGALAGYQHLQAIKKGMDGDANGGNGDTGGNPK